MWIVYEVEGKWDGIYGVRKAVDARTNGAVAAVSSEEMAKKIAYLLSRESAEREYAQKHREQ